MQETNSALYVTRENLDYMAQYKEYLPFRKIQLSLEEKCL